MAGAHIAEPVWPGREGTRGGLQQVWTVAWAKRGKVVVGERSSVSRTNFSHGIWVLHRHPKSIGCAYRLGFGRAGGKMMLDLSLTYGREQRGGALRKHPRILFVERSLYGPICHSTLDSAVCELAQSASTCRGTCYESRNGNSVAFLCQSTLTQLFPKFFLFLKERPT